MLYNYNVTNDINYTPKLLFNIYKNKIHFYILNHNYKNMLYMPNPRNFKNIYNTKTTWFFLLKKIKIILKFLLLPITIIQYRWFYFIKNIYLYLFKPLHLNYKKFYTLQKSLIINTIIFKKLYIYTTVKTKKKRSLKRKLQKKIF